MNENSIKRTLSSVLITAFAFGFFALPAQAAVISATQYATTTQCTNLTVGLSYGKSDAVSYGQVSALQNFLHLNNYLSVNPTGYFGPLTRVAVKAFQSENGLRADGIVGVQTRAQIYAKGCGDYTPPGTLSQINGIYPAIATVGSSVTLNGSGFTNNSIVHFSIGAVNQTIVGNNGTTLSFTIPDGIGPYCKPTQVCALYLQLVTNGTYPVYVENSNGTVSNTVQLTVTGNPSPVLNAQ
ncbi:MAG: peptidoglycan-binding domain-containing protein [Candidatus Paceibacterota bacterium]